MQVTTLKIVRRSAGLDIGRGGGDNKMLRYFARDCARTPPIL
jgi:hypothetical protein